jgi:hypothetical protein
MIALRPGLHDRVNRIMSREIVREPELMTLLGTMDGETACSTRLLVDGVQPANVAR